MKLNRLFLRLLVISALIVVSIYFGHIFALRVVLKHVPLVTVIPVTDTTSASTSPTLKPSTKRPVTTTSKPPTQKIRVHPFTNRPSYYSIIPNDGILQNIKQDAMESIYNSYISTVQVMCPCRVYIGSLRSGWPACTLEYSPDCSMYFIADKMPEQHEFESFFRCSVKLMTNSSFTKDLSSKNSSVIRELSSQKRVAVMVTESRRQLEFFAKLARQELLGHVEQIYVRLEITNESTTPQQYSTYLQQLRDIYQIKDTAVVKSASPLPGPGILQNVTGAVGAAIYHDYVLDTQFLCNKMVRVGHIGNGGWEICNDTKIQPSSKCLVYSFGVIHDWAFEIETIRKFGCSVYAFDHSNDIPLTRNASKIIFDYVGLWDSSTFIYKNKGGKFKMETLDKLLSRFGHEKAIIDVLKIDITGAEWHVLPNLLDTGVLAGVKQLLIEVHSQIQGADEKFRDKLSLLWELRDAGFMLFWSQPGDNPDQIFRCSVNKRHTSCCYKLHFVNKRFH